MDYIPDFIARKNGQQAITYDIPCMEKYLKDTLVRFALMATHTREQVEQAVQILKKIFCESLTIISKPI